MQKRVGEIFKPIVVHCLEKEIGLEGYDKSLIFDLKSEKFPAIKRVNITPKTITTYRDEVRVVKKLWMKVRETFSVPTHNKSFYIQITSTESPENTDIYGFKYTNADIFIDLPAEDLQDMFDKAAVLAELKRKELHEEHVRQEIEKFQLMVDNTLGKSNGIN